jgi:hypothetical protein
VFRLLSGDEVPLYSGEQEAGGDREMFWRRKPAEVEWDLVGSESSGFGADVYLSAAPMVIVHQIDAHHRTYGRVASAVEQWVALAPNKYRPTRTSKSSRRSRTSSMRATPRRRRPPSRSSTAMDQTPWGSGGPGLSLLQIRDDSSGCVVSWCPVTPPPGWAPEPHRYSPRMGVRYWAARGWGRRLKSWSRSWRPWKISDSVRP